jgi:small-conductance mechanosensitive channel
MAPFSGIIESITLRKTTLTTLSGAQLVIPNRHIIGGNVQTWNADERGIIVDYKIIEKKPKTRAQLNAHIQHMITTLEKAHGIYAPPRSTVFVIQSDHETVTFLVRIDVKKSNAQDAAYVLSEVKKALLYRD